MKVLIFTPTYEGKDYCLDKFLASAKLIKDSYPNTRHIIIDNSKTPDYYMKLVSMGLDAHRVQRGNNSRESLARAQNYAREIALKENYDFLFSLESDIIAPPNTLIDLLVAGKEVVTGLYYIGDRDKIRVPCITVSKWNKELGAFGTRLLTIAEWSSYYQKGLKEVQAGGMGCCLISRRVFSQLPFTYDPRFTGHSDIYFFNTVKMRKIKTFVHTDIVCEHDNSDWKKVADR
jgi:hypothetical protein